MIPGSITRNITVKCLLESIRKGKCPQKKIETHQLDVCVCDPAFKPVFEMASSMLSPVRSAVGVWWGGDLDTGSTSFLPPGPLNLR